MNRVVIGAASALAMVAWATAAAMPRTTKAVPRAATTVQVPITGQALTTDGRTVTLSGTVNVATSDVVPPPPPPPGPGAVTVTMVQAASGASITSAVGGTIVYVRGSGLGAGGTLKIAGQAVAVLDWQVFAITAKLPVVAITQTGPVVVAPTGVNAGTSSFAFSIVGNGTPPPPPPPGLVEWPAGSKSMWKRNAGGYYQPEPPSYPWGIVGTKTGVEWPVGEKPPWEAAGP